MSNLILYRKICLKEANDIEKRLFQIIDSGYKDTRKWFTESLIGALRFQNPYAEAGNEVVIRIVVEEQFLKYRELSKMIFQKNQGYKFYRNSNLSGPIIVCPTHLVTTKFNNYGMKEKATQVLNERVLGIELFGLNEMADLYVRENFGVQNPKDLISSFIPTTENYFYIAMPQDLGLALKHEHLIFSEGMAENRKRIVSKDIELIRKANPSMPTLLAVELIEDSVSNEWIRGLERSGICELDLREILKINPWIKHVELIDMDLSKGSYKVYQHIGNNQRLLHHPKENPALKPLTEDDLKEIQELLKKGKFEQVISKYFSVLFDMKGCYQLDPKHIDDVYEHTVKGIVSLEQVIQTLSFSKELTEDDIFLMQLAILFHDIGKPYTGYDNEVTRYTQFTHHYEMVGKDMIDQMFQNYEHKELLKQLASISTMNGKRKYHHLFESFKEMLEEDKKEKAIWMSFILKVAHIMTLKPQKFSAYYQECINYLHHFLYYNSRVWRKENMNNQIITPTLVAQLPSLEATLQPHYQIKNGEPEEIVEPILLELLKTGLNEFYAHDFLAKKDEYSSLLPQVDLVEAITMLKNSDAFPLFQEELSAIRMEALLNSRIHGVYHNEKVAFFVTLIGLNEGCSMKEISLLLKAAIYHDCGRENDHDETRHGTLGAKKFKALFQEHISPQDMRMISFMIEAHAIADSSIKELLLKYQVTREEQALFLKLASILKDADGLDRIRISMELPYSKLNPNYLRTETALRLIKVSHELNECYQKQYFYQGKLLKRKLYQKSNLCIED